MKNWLLGSAIATILLGSTAIATPATLLFAQASENRSTEGKQLLEQGARYYSIGQFQEAIRAWENALKVYQESSDSPSERLRQRIGEGSALNNLGAVYKLLGEYDRAIAYFQQSLAIDRERGDRAGESYSLNNLGVVYKALGEYERAIVHYQQSLTIAREIGDLQGESDYIGNLGAIYQILGEYSRAIEHLERALALKQEIGNRGGLGRPLISLGNVYHALQQYPEAIDYYRQSLAVFQDIGDRVGEGDALLGLGNVYDALGEYAQAREAMQQSLTIARELGNRSGERNALGNLGLVSASLGEYRKAIAYYQQSLTLSQELGDRAREGYSFNNMGLAYKSLGEYAKAIAHLDDSLTIARELGDWIGEGKALYNLASAQHEEGNDTAALKDIEASIAIAESIRADIENPDLRQTFFATVSNRYRLYIEILMQLHQQHPDRNYDKQALQASEKNRARTLTDLLAEAHLDIRQNIAPSFIAEEKRLLQGLSRLEKRRLRLVASSYENAELDRLAEERDRLLKAISNLETRIRRDNPIYADLKYPQPLTLEEIQRDILDENTLLLEYALGDKRSYLFVVGKTEFATYELPPRHKIEAAAVQYAIALQAEDRDPLPEGKDLAKMLLDPIADRLKGQRLAIVADGKLHRLPFGALPWREIPPSSGHPPYQGGQGGSPLLVNHEIVHLSSASSLAIQRQQFQNRPRAAKKIAVFADPVFSTQDPRLSAGEVATIPSEVTSITSTDSFLELFREGCQSFDRLLNTRTEAENILALVPDNQAFLAMGFAADRDAATSTELAQYEILHLSTHGCIQDNPKLSGLALSLYDEMGKQQDGFLRLQDIYNLQLNADLVVLSACQTGIGEEVSGEGVVGLTRGFMYAGARRVTVSLWNVSDRATANLMSEYYENMLSEGMSPAAALREAQLQMWREGEYPYQWAAFIIQGDWQ